MARSRPMQTNTRKRTRPNRLAGQRCTARINQNAGFHAALFSQFSKIRFHAGLSEIGIRRDSLC